MSDDTELIDGGAGKVELPPLDVTKEENGLAGIIPSTIAHPYVAKLLCRERQLLAALTELQSLKADREIKSELYKALRACVVELEFHAPGHSYAEIQMANKAIAKAEAINGGGDIKGDLLKSEIPPYTVPGEKQT